MRNGKQAPGGGGEGGGAGGGKHEIMTLTIPEVFVLLPCPPFLFSGFIKNGCAAFEVTQGTATRNHFPRVVIIMCNNCKLGPPAVKVNGKASWYFVIIVTVIVTRTTTRYTYCHPELLAGW